MGRRYAGRDPGQWQLGPDSGHHLCHSSAACSALKAAWVAGVGRAGHLEPIPEHAEACLVHGQSLGYSRPSVKL